jgi:hypothetical protein
MDLIILVAFIAHQTPTLRPRNSTSRIHMREKRFEVSSNSKQRSTVGYREILESISSS